MLFPFFIAGILMAMAGTVCALIGYDTREHHWVHSVWEYVTNFFTTLGTTVLPGILLVAVYVAVFGWPSLD